MAKIKLFSGLDFSGKSTIAGLFHETYKDKTILRHKFISDEPEVLAFKSDWRAKGHNQVWYGNVEDYKPILDWIIGIYEKDISNFSCHDKIVICDSIWLFKLLSGAIDMGGFSEEYIERVKDVLRKLPDMDSYYITAPHEEKEKRAHKRALAQELTPADRSVLDNPVSYKNRERIYRELVFDRFPDTRVLDSGEMSPKEMLDVLQADAKFMEGL